MLKSFILKNLRESMSYNCYLINNKGQSVFFDKNPDLSKGDLFISVSQILSMLGGSDFLITWALKTFGGRVDPLAAHRSYMEHVSGLGSKLHKWCEYDLKNQKYPDKELSEDMIPGIEAWDKFKEQHEIELIDSERILFSRTYRFAGTIDLRVKIDGITYIADLKTGSVQHKAFIQLTAYKHMMKEMGLSDGSERLLVLGGSDSKNKIADGGAVQMHTLENYFKSPVTEEDLFTTLMCLRELWRFEHLKSRKFYPVIKGMDQFVEPITQRFRDSFNHIKQTKKLKR